MVVLSLSLVALKVWRKDGVCPGHISLQSSLTLPPVSPWRDPEHFSFRTKLFLLLTKYELNLLFLLKMSSYYKSSKDEISEEVHLCWKEERNSCQCPVTTFGTSYLVAYSMLLHKFLLQNTSFLFKLNCKTAISFHMTGRPCELCCWWSHNCAPPEALPPRHQTGTRFCLPAPCNFTHFSCKCMFEFLPSNMF